MKRDEMLDIIAEASLFGTLGFFVGTGFSKAITDGKSPTFKELLEDVASELHVNINMSDPDYVGCSYPDIAEKIVAEIKPEKKNNESPDLVFKNAVCAACDLLPDKKLLEKYQGYFDSIPFQWAITTNYDFLLEYAIGKATALLPNQYLNPREDYVPVYHMHGHVRKPGTIIITDADYIKLFNPIEYRQLKMNLLLAESTTIMIGYALGDVNVKTAMEWSNTFEKNSDLKKEKYQSLVIQALYKKSSCKEHPYSGQNGQIVIEITDLGDFLKEIEDHVSIVKQRHESTVNSLKAVLNKSVAENVGKNEVEREKFLKIIAEHNKAYSSHEFIEFLEQAIGPNRERARKDGNFQYYNIVLQVLIDLLVQLPESSLDPVLVRYLATKLDDLAYFIDKNGDRIPGKSFAATATWRKRKNEINPKIQNEIRVIAKANKLISLEELLSPKKTRLYSSRPASPRGKP